MRTRLRCFLAVAVVCLSLPITGLAAPAGSQLPDTGGATASGVIGATVVGDAQLGTLEQPAVLTRAPVVYLVQQPVAAPAAPAAPVEPKATVSAGDTGGLLGKVGGIVGIFGFLGMGLLVLFKLWTGERSTAVRMAVINAAEAAWYSGEAVGGPTGDKIKASSEAFLKGMEALGIKRPDAQQLALRDAAFESMSKADKVTKARLAALAAPAKEPASGPQTPLAG